MTLTNNARALLAAFFLIPWVLLSEESDTKGLDHHETKFIALAKETPIKDAKTWGKLLGHYEKRLASYLATEPGRVKKHRGWCEVIRKLVSNRATLEKRTGLIRAGKDKSELTLLELHQRYLELLKTSRDSHLQDPFLVELITGEIEVFEPPYFRKGTRKQSTLTTALLNTLSDHEDFFDLSLFDTEPEVEDSSPSVMTPKERLQESFDKLLLPLAADRDLGLQFNEANGIAVSLGFVTQHVQKSTANNRGRNQRQARAAITKVLQDTLREKGKLIAQSSSRRMRGTQYIQGLAPMKEGYANYVDAQDGRQKTLPISSISPHQLITLFTPKALRLTRVNLLDTTIKANIDITDLLLAGEFETPEFYFQKATIASPFHPATITLRDGGRFARKEPWTFVETLLKDSNSYNIAIPLTFRLGKTALYNIKFHDADQVILRSLDGEESAHTWGQFTRAWPRQAYDQEGEPLERSTEIMLVRIYHKEGAKPVRERLPTLSDGLE